MAGQDSPIEMRVTARRELTRDVTEFTLEPAADIGLPSYAPGAHITLQTPSGAMRRYSLILPGIDPDKYVIAVKKEPASRGGSRSMHEDAHEGRVLAVQPPKNDFELKEAPKYLLIAGGIGITPIYCMARHLASEDKDFQIIYCTRKREETAYLEELQKAFGECLSLHHDDGDPDQAYDFWEHFAEPQNMHVYCCGPRPLMESIEAISGHWPEGRVHFEDFKPVEVVRPDDVAFDVELVKSGVTLTVPADRSILEVVRDSGVSTVSSCESGTCGTCKTRLVSGEADHRDLVLMDDEREDNIMICISRAKTGKLAIDL